MRRLYDRTWGRLRPEDQISALALVALVFVTAAIVGNARSQPAPRPVPPAGQPVAEQPPPCRDVEVGDGERAVTCRTATKTLHIGAEGVPILMPTTQVRVLETRSEPQRLRIRVRVRNTGDAAAVARTGRSGAYLDVAGRRVRSRGRPPQRIRPDAARTLTYVFAFDAAALGRLRRNDGRAELAVAPLEAADAASSPVLAVVRLRLSVRRLAPEPPAAPPAVTPPAATPPAVVPG